MSNTTQMDFIGSSLSEPTYKQLSFIEEGNKLTCGREPSFHAVEKFFNGLNRDAIDSHQEYWSKLEPTSLKEKFRRWVFGAQRSVHRTEVTLSCCTTSVRYVYFFRNMICIN